MTPMLWLDRPWWKRGLLYHLYLVLLKDNWFRGVRAARETRVRARLALRWFIRRMTGRWATVPRLLRQSTLVDLVMARVLARAEVMRQRKNNPRALLTGMVAALIGSPAFLPPYSPWEYYRAHAGRKRRYDRGVPTRRVGYPVVYKHRAGLSSGKLGVTGWVADYTPRHEKINARRLQRKLRASVLGARCSVAYQAAA